jgi:signal transduction histidine kinase
VVLIVDNLSTRISAILLAGMAALLLAGAALLVWPTPDGGVRFFQLPLPAEARTIAEAAEASPPASRAAVIRALDSSVIRVSGQAGFPPQLPGARPARPGDFGYRAYARALGGRDFRIDLREGRALTNSRLGRRPLRLSVRLRDGEVLVMQRRPPQTARGLLARVIAAVAAVLLVTLGMLALAVRQATRPVTELAREVARFGDGLSPRPLPLRGPGEIRALAAAFNALQDRIAELLDQRTRILAAVAHDMRTYLTRLSLRTEFIADPAQREKAARDLAEMSAMLDDTLLFARQDRTDAPAAEPLDLTAELAALAAARRELGETVSVDLEPGLAARTPQLVLRRMVGNLLDNAARYGGAARVVARRLDGEVSLAVVDDGPGVDPAILDRLAQPFERGEASRSRGTGGVGLGLSIVQALAHAHGGRLLLANRPEGGFRAEIRLPAASRAPT